MKSLASITDNDIETIKMALNDSISDMTSELKNELSLVPHSLSKNEKFRGIFLHMQVLSNCCLATDSFNLITCIEVSHTCLIVSHTCLNVSHTWLNMFLTCLNLHKFVPKF